MRKRPADIGAWPCLTRPGAQRGATTKTRHTQWMGRTNIRQKGMSLGFTCGIGLSPQKPLFLEMGGKLVWTHGIEKTGLTTRTDYLTSSFNLCAAYQCSLFDGNVTLSVFTGPNVKFNIIGRRKDTAGHSGESWATNYLNREEDHPAKIFQVGWNAGVGLKYMGYYFGYTFQPDFNAYMKNDEGDKLRSFCHSLSVGYEF